MSAHINMSERGHGVKQDKKRATTAIFSTFLADLLPVQKKVLCYPNRWCRRARKTRCWWAQKLTLIRTEKMRRKRENDNRPVNLHPLFLFWKHGSVCDPEKNQVQNMDLKKSGCKKQGHCYSNFFLNSNDPVPDPKKLSSWPDKLEKWVQIDWTNRCILHTTLNI